MKFGLSGSDHVLNWLAATENPDRREALLTWLRAVCIDPEMATSGYLERVGRGRRLNFSDVPGARCRVTFLVVKVPVVCVHIVDISDELYGT